MQSQIRVRVLASHFEVSFFTFCLSHWHWIQNISLYMTPYFFVHSNQPPPQHNLQMLFFFKLLSRFLFRRRAVCPSPRKWCLLCTWTNSAPSSFPPCSWPAAAAVILSASSRVKFVFTVLSMWATWQTSKHAKYIKNMWVIHHMQTYLLSLDLS